MRRRTFLQTCTGTAALGAVAGASAHPTVSGGNPPPEESPVGPDPLGTLPIDGATEAVVRDGTTVFVATTDGFAVVDASDPADPTVSYRTDSVLDDREGGPIGGLWDVKVDGDRLLVAGPANAGQSSINAAVVYDVSDPADPERVTVHETGTPIHNAFLADGVVYLTGNGFDGNPLVTVDAESGEELGRWSLFDHDDAWRDVARPLRVLHDVWVRGDRAYLAHWDAGTWILDVADPASPSVVSRVRGRPVDELADVGNPSREATELPGNDHFVTLDDSGDLLGVGLESWAADEDSERGPGGIYLYDISDEANPEEVAHVHPPPTPEPTRRGVWTTSHNFELVGERLYASWYQGGVKVYDVGTPSNPRELFHWRDADRAKFWTAQLGVPGEFFVASSWETPGDADAPGGLFTFPDPERETAPSSGGEAGSETDGGVVGAAGEGFDWVAGLGGFAALGLAALGVGASRSRR